MDFLKILDSKIVNQQDQPVYLRGVNIGGWMNMENFIDGYPGSESRLRALVKERLGEEKAAFFFERFLDYFFNELDVQFLRSSGVRAIRLPVNYRHFENDLAPFEYLECGFARLDQALAWCEKHGIYVILDLHAVQGWQNGDWHCDNSSRHALFWSQKMFQDRFVALWKEFARRYKDRAVVAVFNLMNEPLSNAPFGRFYPDSEYRPNWEIINTVYRRTIEAIRKIDTRHIIALEGDYHSVLFDGLDEPYDTNVMYSNHNYIEVATSDIPAYPLDLNGTRWDFDRIHEQFVETEGYHAAQDCGVPLLVGEFGFNAHHSGDQETQQLWAFNDQLEVYNQNSVHWTFWTYKDVGSMGWIQLDPESAYMQTIRPVLKAKELLRTDFGWLAGFPPEIQTHITALSSRIADLIPEIDPSTNRRYFSQATMSTYTADQLQELYVQQFIHKSEKEIDAILQSLKLESCIQRQELNALIAGHLK